MLLELEIRNRSWKVLSENEIQQKFENVCVESFSESKKKIKADLKANQTNLTFWKWKFSKEFFIILIILIAVLFLAFYDKIESSTVGTLLGSIIGYAIGNFNSKEKQN